MKKLKEYFFVIVAIISVISLSWVLATLHTTREHDKSYVGKIIVIQRDTLEIVRYREWNGSYILSNGAEVGVEYAQNKTIDE